MVALLAIGGLGAVLCFAAIGLLPAHIVSSMRLVRWRTSRANGIGWAARDGAAERELGDHDSSENAGHPAAHLHPGSYYFRRGGAVGHCVQPCPGNADTDWRAQGWPVAHGV